MFERYNVNDLYLASINVMYSETITIAEAGFGGMSFSSGIGGYGYITVVRKDGDKYIDLQNPNRKLVNERDLTETSYIIEYIEPLNKYYTQDGKNKEKLGKRKSLKLAKNYYEEYHNNHVQYMNEKMSKMYR